MSFITSQTAISTDIINHDVQNINDIKRNSKSQREQLKKVSTEFEAIFVTKMISALDKTVDREGGIFGSENIYMGKFKSFIYNEVGRQIAKNPYSTVGFAKQIYTQMEKSLPKEPTEIEAMGMKNRVDKEI